MCFSLWYGFRCEITVLYVELNSSLPSETAAQDKVKNEKRRVKNEFIMICKLPSKTAAQIFTSNLLFLTYGAQILRPANPHPCATAQ